MPKRHDDLTPYPFCGRNSLSSTVVEVSIAEGQRRAFERIEKLAEKNGLSVIPPCKMDLRWWPETPGPENAHYISQAETLKEAIEKAEKETNTDEHHGT